MCMQIVAPVAGKARASIEEGGADAAVRWQRLLRPQSERPLRRRYLASQLLPPKREQGLFFYNGKVQTCVDVMFPSGKKKRVVAIN